MDMYLHSFVRGILKRVELHHHSLTGTSKGLSKLLELEGTSPESPMVLGASFVALAKRRNWHHMYFT
jgi:hypothetical protein